MTSMKRSLLRSSIPLFFIFFIFSSLLLGSTGSAQTQHSMYLNKIGECSLVIGYDVNVEGNYAYVTNNDGVMIVDVSNPKNPEKVSEILTGQAPFAVEVADERCFSAFSSGQIHVHDVSDPLNPQSVASSVPVSGVVTSIVVCDTHVFVSFREYGFRIFNFTGTSLDLLHSYSDTRGESIAVKEDMLYFGNPNVGIKVFNISTINSPSYIRTVSSGTSVWDMYIHENLLYVGCHGAGIRIYSLSNPTNPSLLENMSEDDGGEASRRGSKQ